ncbi:MAG: ribosome silencing factor [Anaerolineae bacterium]|nr:ribosome silencing factor [Anaerolineae bacterium]MDW8098991.1 ribosome silencing factor [Anaerolineae bacterium]
MRRWKLESTELAHAIVDLVEEHQAEDIVMLDLRPVSILADYFIICSSASERQSRALMQVVDEGIGHLGKTPLGVEGSAEAGWILMDYGDVVVHIFSREKRAYYGLEQFWRRAPIVVKVQ